MYPSRSGADYNFQAWRAKWDDVKQSADPQQAQTGTSLWTQIADTPTLCPSVVSCGGKLYTIGGQTRSDRLSSTVYTYVTARNQWDCVGDMSLGRVQHCAVALKSTSIFVAGGQGVKEDQVSYIPLAELLLL